MNKFNLKFSLFGFVLVLGIIFYDALFVSAQQATCPENDPWVKIEGLESTSYTYTVPQGKTVVEWCWKAANDVVYGTIGTPSTTTVSVNSTAINDNNQIQNLSHASFKLIDSLTPTPTPTIIITPTPTPTLSPTLTPTPTPSESPTPTAKPSPTSTPKPTVTETPDPTSTPNPTATMTPAPTATPTPTNNNDNDDGRGGGEVAGVSASTSQGEVLGISTLASTGGSSSLFAQIIMLLGLGMFIPAGLALTKIKE